MPLLSYLQIPIVFETFRWHEQNKGHDRTIERRTMPVAQVDASFIQEWLASQLFGPCVQVSCKEGKQISVGAVRNCDEDESGDRQMQHSERTYCPKKREGERARCGQHAPVCRSKEFLRLRARGRKFVADRHETLKGKVQELLKQLSDLNGSACRLESPPPVGRCCRTPKSRQLKPPPRPSHIFRG